MHFLHAVNFHRFGFGGCKGSQIDGLRAIQSLLVTGVESERGCLKPCGHRSMVPQRRRTRQLQRPWTHTTDGMDLVVAWSMLGCSVAMNSVQPDVGPLLEDADMCPTHDAGHHHGNGVELSCNVDLPRPGTCTPEKENV